MQTKEVRICVSDLKDTGSFKSWIKKTLDLDDITTNTMSIILEYIKSKNLATDQNFLELSKIIRSLEEKINALERVKNEL